MEIKEPKYKPGDNIFVWNSSNQIISGKIEYAVIKLTTNGQSIEYGLQGWTGKWSEIRIYDTLHAATYHET